MKNLIRKWLGVDTEAQVAEAADKMFDRMMDFAAHGGCVPAGSPESLLNTAIRNKVLCCMEVHMNTALQKEEVLQQIVERIRKVQL